MYKYIENILQKSKRFQSPDVLDEYIRGLITDDEMYYLLLDEIQKVDDFESMLNGFFAHREFRCCSGGIYNLWRYTKNIIF